MIATSILLFQEVIEPVTSLPPAAEPLSLLDTFVKGGLLMIPIAVLSLVAIAILIERLRSLRQASTDPRAFMDRVRDYILDGDIRGATGYCAAQDTAISRILQHGLARIGREISDIQESVQAAGKHETFLLQKRTSVLATIAGVSPMLGFLGTITGMISAFQQIESLQGNVNPSVLANGIWEALISTAFGLAVGIIAFFAYNFLTNKIDRIVNDMELSATDFIDMLREPTPSKRPSERQF